VINRLLTVGLEGFEMAVALDFDAVLVPVAPRVADAMAVRTTGLRSLGFARPSLSTSMSCLVVSGDASLRRRFDAAADLGGWSTVAAPSDLASLAQARRHVHQVVVIDLVSPLGGDRSAVESLARELSGRPDTLLMVCGGVESGADESWSRAQGAFVHIPGVSSVELSGDSLVSLFVEARRVSERRSGMETGGQVGSSHAVGVRG
jgi:hypothetical protein